MSSKRRDKEHPIDVIGSRLLAAEAMTLLLFNAYDVKEDKFALAPLWMFNALASVQMLLEQAQVGFEDMLDQKRRKEVKEAALVTRAR